MYIPVAIDALCQSRSELIIYIAKVARVIGIGPIAICQGAIMHNTAAAIPVRAISCVLFLTFFISLILILLAKRQHHMNMDDAILIVFLAAPYKAEGLIKLLRLKLRSYPDFVGAV